MNNALVATVASSARPWYMQGGTSTRLTHGEMQKFCRGIVESRKYRRTIKRRMQSGKINPQMEMHIWDRAYGKVTEQIAMTVSSQGPDLSNLSLEELEERAQDLLVALNEAKQIREALPAIFVAAA